MDRIVIAICTYNRQRELRGLLRAIGRQQLDAIRDEQIQIIVVDNSKAKNAENVCHEFVSDWRFPLSYVSEPHKGLSFARNAALTAALEAKASHLAFIDDDETPDPTWAEQLYAKLRHDDVAASVGPVYPIFETPPSPWLPMEAYATLRQPTNGLITDGYMGNCMLAMSAIEHLDLRFDPKFNETGGEDTAFFQALTAGGFKTAWTGDARVHEYVPRSRMSARWLWKRWYRTGLIEAQLASSDTNKIHGRLTSLMRGAIRLIAGSLRIIAASPSLVSNNRATFVASFYTACRGAGFIANALGLTYREYQGQR